MRRAKLSRPEDAGSALRWIVREGDGLTVGAVLAQAGVDSQAVPDGRVFVGPRRVRSASEGVTAGDLVRVWPPRPQSDACVRLLVRTSDLVAADKPAGIPTIPDHAGGAHALVAAVARTLGIDDAQRLHPTSRLDRDVSGVVFFALTKEAAERLRRARTEGAPHQGSGAPSGPPLECSYVRRYVAIAVRAPEPPDGVWNAPIGRARDPRRRAAGGPDSVPASTRYSVRARTAHEAHGTSACLLALSPQTGRTHQIRVHAAHAGAPLVGDRAYGGPSRITLPNGRVLEPRRIALHCARVVVPDGQGRPVVAQSPIPPDLVDLWTTLGGEPSAWQVGASCELP